MKIYRSLLLIMLVFGVQKLISQDIIEMRSQTIGFSGGIHVAYLSYTQDYLHEEAQDGIGFGAQIQYGFNHQFAASLAYQFYSLNSGSTPILNSPYPFSEVDLLGKYIFGSTTTPLRPYISLGLNYSRSKQDFYNQQNNFEYTSATYSGITFCGGGGLSYFFSPEWSVDASFLFHTGSFSTIYENRVLIDDSLKFTSIRGTAGVVYHF